MAAPSQSLAKAASRTTFSSLRSPPRSCYRSAARQLFQNYYRRQYSSERTFNKSRTGRDLVWVAAAATVSGIAGYCYSSRYNYQSEVRTISKADSQSPIVFEPTQKDYQGVYDVIAKALWDKDDYDDGSYGPVLLRLAWHASGTYDAATGTGGSNGATMRFAPEGDHNANAGLVHARDFLEPIKQQFPWISYGDLWTLGGVCAIQEMQGPVVPWRPGRQDKDVTFCTPDGRLPDGSKGQDHIRAIFGRMGFNDQEMVALSGAHALGRCHKNRSGFDGPWTFSPTVFTNDYFRLLVEEKWSWKDWEGPKQLEDATTKTLMMLPSDVALVKDAGFKEHVERYARDSQVFFHEFSDALVKLFELGVPFAEGTERLNFKTYDDEV